jgi:hypothetical protein
VDKKNKPQPTSGEEVTPAPPPAPLQARSPYRPLSRRRRQDQVVEPPPAVERPSVSMTFDASPTRINAALAKAGASPEDPVLIWKGGRPNGASGCDKTAADAPDGVDAADIEVVEGSDTQG